MEDIVNLISLSNIFSDGLIQTLFQYVQYVGSDVDAICWVRRGCNMLDQTWKQYVGSNLVVIRWFRRWCDMLVQTGFQYDGSDVVAVCWFRRGCNKFIQNWL